MGPRFVGGVVSNFPIIRKSVELMEQLRVAHLFVLTHLGARHGGFVFFLGGGLDPKKCKQEHMIYGFQLLREREEYEMVEFWLFFSQNFLLCWNGTALSCEFGRKIPLAGGRFVASSMSRDFTA